MILRPADRQQVQACLRVANAHRVAVYPISTGRNWGYGSRVPAADGSVLLDLGRMNRIVDFSEDLAYVTVEPGVTQQQLFDFLRDNRSRLWMDATGARPDCSLIGNTMERGFGHTPYGDHFAHVCGFEVVLPDGECIETGFSRFAQASTGPLYRWGLGPTLDGLFTQSNFGIVTRMSIWLMPAPEHFEAFFFRCDDDSGLGDVLDALAAAAAERNAAERRAHRQRLQGAERHRAVSVGPHRRHDAARARAHVRPSQEAAFRRVERVGRAVWHPRTGPRSEAADASGAPRQGG